MHRVARLVLAALAAQTATGFILPQRHFSGGLQLGAVLSSQTAARDLGVQIFDHDSTIRTAYDEWRGEFGKGAFDDERFEKFKQNFKTLTVANLEAINKAVEALSQVSHKLAEAMYAEAQQEGEAGEGAEQSEAAGEEEVVDAEYEDVEDDKKK